jgi:hypothetical protein
MCRISLSQIFQGKENNKSHRILKAFTQRRNLSPLVDMMIAEIKQNSSSNTPNAV